MRFELIAEARLNFNCDDRFNLSAYCSTHELIALHGVGWSHVSVYRLNGQLAFRVEAPKFSTQAQVISWKPDGSLIGVGWDFGTCGLFSGEDGRLVGRMSTQRTGKDTKDWKLDLRYVLWTQEQPALLGSSHLPPHLGDST